MITVPEDVVAADLVELLPKILDQLGFATMDLVQALLLHPGYSRGQTGDAEDVGGAAFEEVGIFLRLGFVGRIAAGAAFAPYADLGARADIERASAGGTEE